MNKASGFVLTAMVIAGSLNASAQNVQSYKSKTIKIDSAKAISVKKATGIEPRKSKEIESHKAKEIETYKAGEIELHKAKVIDASKGASPAPAGLSGKERKDAETAKPRNGATPRTAEKSKSSPSANDLESLMGVWRTRVPGAVWQTPSGQTGYDNLHVSAGAASGDLIIRKDGSYTWDSYGGKKGKWEKGDADYPIVLLDHSEKKTWRVGFDPKHTGGREIVIWDGYVWYDGKR